MGENTLRRGVQILGSKIIIINQTGVGTTKSVHYSDSQTAVLNKSPEHINIITNVLSFIIFINSAISMETNQVPETSTICILNILFDVHFKFANPFQTSLRH